MGIEGWGKGGADCMCRRRDAARVRGGVRAVGARRGGAGPAVKKISVVLCGVGGGVPVRPLARS